jgi:hypothetical protein
MSYFGKDYSRLVLEFIRIGLLWNADPFRPRLPVLSVQIASGIHPLCGKERGCNDSAIMARTSILMGVYLVSVTWAL